MHHGMNHLVRGQIKLQRNNKKGLLRIGEILKENDTSGENYVNLRIKKHGKGLIRKQCSVGE